MSALYMSMSANEGEMQIEDDLAKGNYAPYPLMTRRLLDALVNDGSRF